MNQEWVHQKNKERQELYEKKIEFLKHEILNIKWIDDTTILQKILNAFVNKDWFELKMILEFLYLEIPTLDKNASKEELIEYVEKVTEYKKWYKNLKIDELESYENYKEITGHNHPYERYLDTEMFFDGDIIITDPCYIMRAEHHGTTPLFENDWEYCDYGSQLEKLGITHFVTRDTLYGDWSCIVHDLNTKKQIGRFCADAGLVSVMLLDEVVKYNPDYTDYEDPNTWSVTLIRNFKGTIFFKVYEKEYIYEDDWIRDNGTYVWHKGDKHIEYELEIEGHGVNNMTGEPIDFVSKQSGL